MEALERWSAHYPELEALSETMKTLTSSLRAFGEPGPAASEAQVKSTIEAETSIVQKELALLRPNSESLRHSLNNVPLSSLSSLQKLLRKEVQQNSIGIGGEELVQDLQMLLETSSVGAPDSTNNLFEAWVQEFVHEPLHELFEHAKQVMVSMEMNMAMEHGILKQIRSLSEQICQPGYRSDRVELMDTRSVLVQQLLTALGAKQRALGMAESKTAVLDRKLHAFEQDHSSVVRAHREEVAKHTEIAEDLARKAQTMEKYTQQKERAYLLEDKAAEDRRQQRAKKFRRISESLQEAFSSILETIEECRHDKSRVIQAQLEQQHAAEAVREINSRIMEFQELYAAVNRHTEEAGALEQRFANWIREAYNVMRNQAIKHYEALQKMFATDKARMLALSHITVEHVQAQREQVARALELKTLELTSCQEAVSMMEFSKPGGEEIAEKLNKLEAVQEAVKWQQHEVDALTLVEERISRDVSQLMGAEMANSLDAHKSRDGAIERSTVSSRDTWADEVSLAERWVGDFFYTWQHGLACQPKRAATPDEHLESRGWGFGHQPWLRAGSPQQLVDAVASSIGTEDVEAMANGSLTDLNDTSESLSPGILRTSALQQFQALSLEAWARQNAAEFKANSNARSVEVGNDLNIGDLVSARWPSNGEFYVAVIASENDDGTVTVNWQDGRKEFRKVPIADIHKDLRIAQPTAATSSTQPPPVVQRFASDGSITTTSTMVSSARLPQRQVRGGAGSHLASVIRKSEPEGPALVSPALQRQLSPHEKCLPRGRSASTTRLVPNGQQRLPTPTRLGSRQAVATKPLVSTFPAMPASSLPTVPLAGQSMAALSGTPASARPSSSPAGSPLSTTTVNPLYGIGSGSFASTVWGSQATIAAAPCTAGAVTTPCTAGAVVRSSSVPAGLARVTKMQAPSGHRPRQL
mmetsp:Transcript_113010/g.205497  ORF Transcript_113010/g.205497 Transcript_113010/m.205497 type:complete len:928 (-) Transcript_113010:195-2978(-)